MNKSVLRAASTVLALWAPLVFAESFVLGQVGSQQVTVEVPVGWTAVSPPAAMPDAATVRLSRGTPEQALMLLTVMAPPPGSPLSGADAAMVDVLVSASARQASAQSEEGELASVRFERGAARGAYFSATDKAPPPGEYKYLSQGLATVGEFAVTFTALSHAEPAETRDQMLEALGSLTLQPAASASAR